MGTRLSTNRAKFRRKENAQQNGKANIQNDGDNHRRKNQIQGTPLAQQVAIGYQEEQAGNHKADRLVQQRHNHHNDHADEQLAFKEIQGIAAQLLT